MKYSILILDDEPLIVEGLAKKFDWERLNCRICGSASNGLDGKKLMDELLPDIVISDIMMPGLTGLDLAEHNFHRAAPAKFIILTAYSDFSFAKKAIQYRVEDYIVKPIDFGQLEKAVQKAVCELDKSEDQKKKLTQLEDDMKSTRELASASLLFNIAHYSQKGLTENKRILETYMPFETGVVIGIIIYSRAGQDDRVYIGGIQSDFIRSFQNAGHLLLSGSADDKLIFLCRLNPTINIQTARNRVIATASKAAENITSRYHVLCACVVSEAYRNADELHQRYNQNRKRLSQCFFMEQSGVLDLPVPTKGLPQPDVDLVLVLHHLAHGNSKMLKDSYGQVCETLKKAQNEEFAIHSLQELRQQAFRVAQGVGMVQKTILEHSVTQYNFLFLTNEIGQYLDEISNYIQKGQNLTEKLKLMIEEQFSDSSFGLSQAANHMGVNSSYLSRLFKKETEIKFVDYLVDFRIQKAKYLLETTKLKNGEIALAVGFEDERYFGKVFKKKCLITPRQYREQKIT